MDTPHPSTAERRDLLLKAGLDVAGAGALLTGPLAAQGSVARQLTDSEKISRLAMTCWPQRRQFKSYGRGTFDEETLGPRKKYGESTMHDVPKWTKDFFCAWAGRLFRTAPPIMVTTSPRIWGYADYPRAVKDKVPPQSRKEKLQAAVIGLPWIIFVLGFPVYSTLALKAEMGGTLAFPHAFLNLIFLIACTTFGDLVVLDWLIISKITPRFVLIPGSAWP